MKFFGLLLVFALALGVEKVSAEYNRVFNVNWKLFIGLVKQKTRVGVKWITQFPKEVVLYKKSTIAIDERAICINFFIFGLMSGNK